MDFNSLIAKHFIGPDEFEPLFEFWLKAVRENNLAVIHNNTNSKTAFLFYDKGHLLLQEAQSPILLAYLILNGSDVFKTNQNNQRPLEVLLKRIDELTKSKNDFSSQNELLALNQMVKLLQVIENFIKNPIEFQKWSDQKSRYLSGLLIYSNNTKVFDDDETVYRICADILDYNIYQKTKRDKVARLLKAGECLLTPFKEENPQQFICNQNSEPKLCFHGSLVKKDFYHPLMHFGTLKAALDRINNIMKNKYSQSDIEKYRLKQESRNGFLSDKELKPHIGGFYLKIKNPIPAPELCDWGIFGLKSLVIHHQLFKNNSFKDIKNVMKADYNDRLGIYRSLLENTHIPMYHFLFDEPLTMPIQEVKRELQLGNLYPIFDDEKIQKLRDQVDQQKTLFENLSDNSFPSLEKKISLNRTNLIYQRVIRYFESMGYDGVAYTNGWEDAGSTSYIVFRPEQVVDCRFIDKQTIQKRDENAECELNKIVASYQPPQKTMLSPEDVKSFFLSFHYMSFYDLYQKLRREQQKEQILSFNKKEKSR